MEWLWYVLLIGGCSAIVVGVIVSRILAKRKGKPSCDCGCSGCSACAYCKQAKEKKENK